MMLVCEKCGDTYIPEEGESTGTCAKCSAKLVAICEWCNQPEKECTCGKDEIKIE